MTVHGNSLVGNLEGDSPDRMVSVYLPPSYAKSPNARFPVLYLLHGFTDSDARWFGLRGKHFVNVPDAVDRAYAAGCARDDHRDAGRVHQSTPAACTRTP